jgi:hypothetical protein
MRLLKRKTKCNRQLTAEASRQGGFKNGKPVSLTPHFSGVQSVERAKLTVSTVYRKNPKSGAMLNRPRHFAPLRIRSTVRASIVIAGLTIP